MVSTTVFAGSMLPMLLKAARTRDLSSYSTGNLVLANIGNAVHSVYVFHLPAGPIWFLHADDRVWFTPREKSSLGGLTVNSATLRIAP